MYRSMAVMQSAATVDADLGFELCYLEAPGAERREFPVSWPGLRPEGFVPVREFRWARGQGHLPGLWWSATTGSHVGYESWLERDHVMLLDFDPEVAAIVSQPFWLHWRDDAGRLRRHAPGLFARMADGSAVVIDVRSDDRIEPRDAEAFDATRRACRLAGWGFRRVGVPDPVRAANVARRLLRCCTTEQLIHARIQAARQPGSAAQISWNSGCTYSSHQTRKPSLSPARRNCSPQPATPKPSPRRPG
jgi:hypothetical protein